ncbi:hypothetical protein ACIQRW_27455 [Streptomyces sp. NPDC091287]|uniref:hypothetical protein n=1 Tax=Streptomyces sp. NPDC091287 TaxID=3365988 RepID=UPI003812040B
MLQDLGLTSQDERVYRALIERPEAGADELLAGCDGLGGLREVREVLGALIARGLITRQPDGERFTAHAVEQLQYRRASLAVVRDTEGRLTGLISLDDLIIRLMGAQRV